MLASCYGASAADVQLLGAEPGARTTKMTRPVRLTESASGTTAEVDGVNVHAQRAFDGRDRRRLERVCRYLARPPLAQERLTLGEDGLVPYALKSAWRDGTAGIELAPLDLIARLCALVPPPRQHSLRYHGVLAGNAKDRAEVVPSTAAPVGEQLVLLEPGEGGAPAPKRASRHPWAWLLRRVFGADLEEYAQCGGRMRLLRVVDEAADIRHRLGRSARAPPTGRLAGQLTLDFAAA